jgi:hypothetical protein
VDAETSHGTVTNEFSQNRAGGRGRGRVQNTVGDNPTTSLNLRTSNGSIAIHRNP